MLLVYMKQFRAVLCKQEAWAEAEQFQQSMVCCHQERFKLSKFSSAMMTACDVVDAHWNLNLT